MNQYVFPFFGAGVFKEFPYKTIQYFICFEQKPTKKQSEQIADLVPAIMFIHEILRDQLRLKGIEGSILVLLRPQADEVIEEFSQTENNPYEFFNNGMEQIFLKIHEICPIIAIVRENVELKNGISLPQRQNKLSDWHKWSLQFADNLIRRWKEKPDKDIKKILPSLIKNIYLYLEDENIKPTHCQERSFSEYEEDNGGGGEEDDDENKYEELSEEYFSTANGVLVPLITEGIKKAIKKFRSIKEKEGLGFCCIYVNMNYKKNTMEFSYEDKDCNKSAHLYSFSIGAVLSECYEMLEQMEELGGGYSYEQALSNWFEDATVGISVKNFKGLSFSLNVPDVGGDPYIECFDDSKA